MSSMLEKVSGANFDRRVFLKGAAVAAAGAVTASAVGCSSGNQEPQEETVEASARPENTLEEVDLWTDLPDPDAEGTWIPVACWHNCGGRCSNKALVKDGVVLRQKTDDIYADEEGQGHFQNRACPRGRSQQQQCFGADRLKYPMKRKNWEPGGVNVNGELRGVDEWERISWEEALDMIASELQRIYGTYGARSVYFSTYAYGPYSNILNTLGGYVYADTVESYGNWKMCCSAYGTPFYNSNPDIEGANDRFDLPNAETIVMLGGNPSWASGGSPSYHFARAKEAGTKFVYVGPSRNITASMLDARWIPVRPATDTAMLLAVAYVMLEQDEQKQLIDWDFLHTYCVGFDAKSMPEDAVLDENFKDYVLGVYDGVPKTPEWATEICGTPVEDIEWLAETVGKQHKVMLLHSYAAARSNGTENLSQLFLTIGAMGGHMGKSGHATGAMYHYEAGNAGPQLVKLGSATSAFVPNPITEVIPGGETWKAIVDGHYTYCGTSGSAVNGWAPKEERDIDIKAIISGANNFLQSKMNVNDGIRAYRKVEFAWANDYKLSSSCQYSDIVLPVTTKWEGYTPDTSSPGWINRESQVITSPVLEEGLYEAKSDQWIADQLADRLGLDRAALFPVSEKQNYFNMIAGAKYFAGGKLMYSQDSSALLTAAAKAKAAGEDFDMSGYTEEWKPLVTITQEDIDKFGDVVGEPQEGVIGFDEIRAQGVYQVEMTDDKRWIGYKDFIEDPEKYPRPSKSGKFEIYCQTKADGINSIGINPEPIKPYPNYIVPKEGYEESFADWSAKERGEYPFQMYTPHYLRRSHTTLDNLPWLQEAFENPVFMNASDGEALGLKTGDTVLVSSKWGQVLRHVSLMESVMPGAIAVPHGVRTDIDPETGIDTGGSENTLLGPVVSNYFPQVSGYNTCLVKVEKWTGEPIPYDYEKTFIPSV